MKHAPARRIAAILLAAVAMLPCIPAAAASDLTNLRCEYRDNPLGTDAAKPRLSWVMEERSQRSAVRGRKQTAYQVLVASTPELLAKDQGDLWDSKKVASDQSIQVEYAGKPLESRQVCHWKVRVWLNDGQPTPWSGPAGWSMGLLKAADWQAKWVRAGGETSPWLRKEFTLTAVPEQAVAFVNVKGYGELYVNGKKVGEDVLSPAVAVYRKRTLYTTYDISKYLRAGNNCVGVWLGLGLCYTKKDEQYTPIARVQLDMIVGGQRVVVGTDPTWTWLGSSHTEFGWGWCGNGREHIDARRAIDGWSEVGCTNGSWKPVEEFAEPSGVATAQSCPPNRITQCFPVVKCTALKANTYELDFGTNLNGWFTLKLPKLEAGHTVTIRFADKRLKSANEVVTPDKTYELPPGTWKLDTANGPLAYTTYNQEAQFISAGKPGEQLCPKFNYFSFRYAIVEGLPAKPATDDAEALMIESALDPVGTFECSNELLNRIHQVNLWTIRCLNISGYMTDCPHRERMGYGGDGQTSIDTQIMNLDASAFYTKWAIDWLDEQDPVTGKSVQYAPTGATPDGRPDPCCWLLWGGMIDVLPWKTYLYYGDRRLLERAYEPMVRYPTVFVDGCFPDKKNPLQPSNCDTGSDWVAPRVGMQAPPGNQVFVNCYRVYLMDLLAKTADALGKTDEAKKHRARVKELQAMIHAAFYRENEKLYDGDRQLSQAMPLLTGVVPDALREGVRQSLADIVLVKNKGHLDTGMLGTHFLLQSLREMGRNDLAFTIANQQDYPGWGYLLAQGMTTFGEQWDAYWSQIHACYLSPGGWFYQGLAGILPDEAGPGFKQIIIKPAIVGDLTWIKCGYDSVHGKIISNWKRDGDKLTMDVTIPTSTTATVYVPATNAAEVTESGKPTDQVKGVKFQRMEDGAAVYAVDSGGYQFQSTLPEMKSVKR
ncbi:MAG: glycoside hydrolase family 78 protein [Akkermansiaceae bacterium]|nr:glycoside hydrolase family 78 protein [Akkermansiaceae bacterium]MCF7731191.1 glycoside hydrolase family 78 protein [Akkermansiaceae bacterium]